MGQRESSFSFLIDSKHRDELRKLNVYNDVRKQDKTEDYKVGDIFYYKSKVAINKSVFGVYTSSTIVSISSHASFQDVLEKFDLCDHTKEIMKNVKGPVVVYSGLVSQKTGFF